MSSSPTDSKAPRRRRIYLMRHGAVTYFDASGRPVLPEEVPLNEEGRAQAMAAGLQFKQDGVRFDRVIVSGLPRTVQTAALVLGNAGLAETLTPEIWPELQEIRGGRLADIPREQIQQAFNGLSHGVISEEQRFLNGESIAELLDRVLPAIARLRAQTDWDSVLLVLHGVVNAAVLSHAMSGGGRMMLGSLVQAPACINVLDVGEVPQDWLVRVVNFSPQHPLHTHTRHTTMEALLAQYLQYRSER
nr:histidine phosphatase family protein [uncultured Roseateles sp.]